MRQATSRALAAAALLELAGALPLAAQEPFGLPLSGEAAEKTDSSRAFLAYG